MCENTEKQNLMFLKDPNLSVGFKHRWRLRLLFCLCLGQITKHDFNIYFSMQRMTLFKQLISILNQLFTGETISYWTWQAHYVRCRRNLIPKLNLPKKPMVVMCAWECVSVSLSWTCLSTGTDSQQLRYELQSIWAKVTSGWLRWSQHNPTRHYFLFL